MRFLVSLFALAPCAVALLAIGHPVDASHVQQFRQRVQAVQAVQVYQPAQQIVQQVQAVEDCNCYPQVQQVQAVQAFAQPAVYSQAIVAQPALFVRQPFRQAILGRGLNINIGRSRFVQRRGLTGQVFGPRNVQRVVVRRGR